MNEHDVLYYLWHSYVKEQYFDFNLLALYLEKTNGVLRYFGDYFIKFNYKGKEAFYILDYDINKKPFFKLNTSFNDYILSRLKDVIYDNLDFVDDNLLLKNIKAEKIIFIDDYHGIKVINTTYGNETFMVSYWNKNKQYHNPFGSSKSKYTRFGVKLYSYYFLNGKRIPDDIFYRFKKLNKIRKIIDV